MKNKIFLMAAVLFGLFTASCTNDDQNFDDYEYSAVYFAYQFPVRTITLGEDIFDTSLDNQHKCKIMGTVGGVYENNKEVTIDVSVANALTSNLLFNSGGDQIVAMPANYYTLLSNKIVIPKGQISGGVEVQLTDAFFADPLAIKKTYVIPLQMTKVVNADSILSGKALVANPLRPIASDWSVAPKDYVFYAIKYVNPWDGFYLRRGKDTFVGNNGNTALNRVVTRHNQYVEKDQVNRINTLSMKTIDFPVTIKDNTGANINFNLVLTFDDNNGCTISGNNSTQFTATGTGKFVKRGEKNSWGSKDRDALYLDYKVNFQDFTLTTQDTLVLRDRGVTAELFTPVAK
ncbi:DUF5627 domain-containing protein [Flavobacterium sp. HBTb2-11-1]|uniref:DUF5627 domain-containing protein n=1 Tax=Flavobacterium sp. HBTb2-11-1 TaxID=2692212 RepID=UPI00136C457D|nr:DUF5627 domain-containing protein [Flavobacterium sp. HBTb2-11-1]MXO06730.1 DUF1735 domain-containing protein [Flavobacterium sp. HBTb2-11-1]